MDFLIREIEEKDYLEVARLYKELRKVSEKYMFSFYSNYRKNTEMKSNEEIAKSIIKKKALKKDSKFLILEIDNIVVGFIYGSLFFPESEVYVVNDYIGGELDHLFIDETYRGKGFSTKLRNKIFEWFYEKNVKLIEIGVNQDNPSYEIYKKWGFESKYCYVSKIV